MKTIKLVFFSILFCSISATAQYGNNSYGSNGGQRTNSYQQSNSSQPSAEDIENERVKNIDKLMTKLKEELTLDELQFIAIKNEITASNHNIEIVIKREKSEENKTNEIKAIKEQTDKAINSYLNASQKEKFQKLKEDKALNKEEKKKRKR